MKTRENILAEIKDKLNSELENKNYVNDGSFTSQVNEKIQWAWDNWDIDFSMYHFTEKKPESYTIAFREDFIENEDFEDYVEIAFKEYFENLVENIDIDTLIDVTDTIVITPELDIDSEGNEFPLCYHVTYKGKEADISDSENEANGDEAFMNIFYTEMVEYSNQDIKKAAILSGAKYVYDCSLTNVGYNLLFWK